MTRCHYLLGAGALLAVLVATAGCEQQSGESGRPATTTATATVALPGTGGAEQRALAMSHAYPARLDEAGPIHDRVAQFEANRFVTTAEQPVSTFSIDVDTASYTQLRKAILEHGGQTLTSLPAATGLRTEEAVNYFSYDYARPDDRQTPFAIDAAVMPAPWAPRHRILRIGVQGYDLPRTDRPALHLTFLVDVSGSMKGPDKLPLLQRALAMLTAELEPRDRIALVTYAGSSAVVLEPTAVAERDAILDAVDALDAGGRTAGAAGLELAYRTARAMYDSDAINRVIIGTDGDFNVGPSSLEAMRALVRGKRDEGIYLSVLGFGTGNLRDDLMQQLAQHGQGTAAYIDSVLEARKVLVEEMMRSVAPIADDVKIQVEFNPSRIASYRLIGYETRLLQERDFNDDKVDAGEVGSGAAVTALYEIVPADARLSDERRYAGNRPSATTAEVSDEWAWVKLRFKAPGADTSRRLERVVTDDDVWDDIAQAPQSLRFATAVAAFSQKLRGEPALQDMAYDEIRALGLAARGADPAGHRAQFLQLVDLVAKQS